MGLFSKMKNLVGGHGVKVHITEVEGQAADSAALPMHDSILKGRIQVEGNKEVVILNHAFELSVIYETDSDYRSEVLEEDVNEGEIIGNDYSWPYTLAPSKVVDDSFCLGPFDIPAALKEMKLDPDKALNNPNLRLQLKVVADVKGTPVDASTKCSVAMLPGGGE
jgi:hypothetical protein